MTRPDLYRMIVHAAKKQDVPQDLALRQILAESSGNPRAVSPKGAKGLGQLMPGTAKMLGVTNVYDPQENVTASMRYMAQLKRQFGSWKLATIAYIWGPGNLSRYGADKAPKAAREYVRVVWKGE